MEVLSEVSGNANAAPAGQQEFGATRFARTF
jgi:hypothetical protein